MEQFSTVFQEYFGLFRGQASSIPTFGDREFNKAIIYGNNAIRKWNRADGTLWRELIKLASQQTVGVWAALQRQLLSSTLLYTAPNNMRKPPAYVRIYQSTQSYNDVKVTKPEDAMKMVDTTDIIWFSGGANTGYTMVVGSKIAAQYSGWYVDYAYNGKPTLLSLTADPSATVVEMSDINYMIQDMLSSAFSSARNGFGYKTAQKEASSALLNMKIEDASGVQGNADSLGLDSGWGANTPVGEDILL